MSTDVIDREVESEDGVTVVNESAETVEANRERQNAELLKRVEGIVGGDDKKPSKEKQSGKEDEKAPAEGADDKKPVDLSQAMKDRAKEVGIPDDLAERLNQSGLLEESLAAIDRREIDRRISEGKSNDKEPTNSPPKPPAKAEADNGGVDEGEMPPLDEDSYDEALVKRDRLLQSRIKKLESQISNLTKLATDAEKRSSSIVDQWLESSLAKLGNEELFGKGTTSSLPKDGTQAQNRAKLFDGYRKICKAFGGAPEDCNEQFIRRAYSAVFFDQVFKAAQRDTVRKLRDAQGQFINPSRPGSGGPPARKRQTPEERDGALLKKVEGIISRKN